MPCTITDKLQYYTSSNTAAGLSGLTMLAVPSSNTIFELIGGSYRLFSKGIITTDAYSYGRTTLTDGTGTFTFVLPYSTETHPLSPPLIWNLIFPDGRILSGVVPAVAGPLLLDDLVTTYSWVWTAAATYLSPGNGVFAKGSAPFSAQESLVINFTTPFTSSTYEITLTPSIDTVTSAIPVTGYSNKTMNGFTINTSGTYSGAIDWVAQA